MVSKQTLLIFMFAFLIAGSLVSCQANATPTLAELSGPGIGVGISDDSCPVVTVKVGQQISWTNQGRQEHLVRAKSVQGESGFDSGTLQPGGSFTVTLTEPDTFTYDCSADGSLTGTITIEL